MAWNPSKEVAVARDAARQLDDASVCVVVWITKDRRQVGAASYGCNAKTCFAAKALCDALYEKTVDDVTEYRRSGGEFL